MCLVLKESKFSIVAKIFSRILYKHPTVLGDFELLRTVPVTRVLRQWPRHFEEVLENTLRILRQKKSIPPEPRSGEGGIEIFFAEKYPKVHAENVESFEI